MSLHLGDCLAVLQTVEPNSIDAVVTDPPYGLSFMGKKWDYDVPSVELWREVLRVLKPGGHVLSFGGTRTYHRMVVNIEDAGFEIRDQLQWIYGSGFPKSLDVSKAIDKAAGAEREVVGFNPNHRTLKETNTMVGEPHSGDGSITAPSTDLAKQWQGWGTALKPANEPIVLARKPLIGTVASNVEQYGTGAMNIDASRIAVSENDPNKRKSTGGYVSVDSLATVPNAPYNKTRDATLAQGRWPANVLFDEWDEPVLTLLDSTPTDAKAVIEEFYAGYCKLSDLQGKDCHISEPQEQNEVLQSGMFCEGRKQESERQESSHVREVTFIEVDSQDAQGETRDSEARLRESEMEGRMALSGLSLHPSRDADGETKIDSRKDDDGGSRTRGASSCDGIEIKAPTKGKRSRASQKRDETRQPSEQSRTSRYEHSQERTLASLKGSAATPLFVRESDVPQMWSRYFKDSGFTVRAGSAAVLDAQSGNLGKSAGGNAFARNRKDSNTMSSFEEKPLGVKCGFGDSGGASRFFYVAKASKRERGEGNVHPTVKPVKLMEYLVRMITPPGGIVLDPFMGSGTTGVACKRLGFKFFGVERDIEYFRIAGARIESVVPTQETKTEEGQLSFQEVGA